MTGPAAFPRIAVGRDYYNSRRRLAAAVTAVVPSTASRNRGGLVITIRYYGQPSVAGVAVEVVKIATVAVGGAAYGYAIWQRRRKVGGRGVVGMRMRWRWNTSKHG